MLTRYVVPAIGEAESVAWRAHLALLGLLAYAPAPSELLVVTDHPERFRWFDGRVRIHQVAAADLEQWQGPQRSATRLRVQVLRLAAMFQPAAGVVVLCDPATVARGDLGPVGAAVREGRVAMERRDRLLVLRPGLWRTFGRRTWAGLAVDERTELWRTAVVAMGAADYALADRILAVCDAMQAAAPREPLAADLAIGAVLSAEGRAVEIDPLRREPLITCYGSDRAAWDDPICRLLASIHLHGLGVDEAVDRFVARPVLPRAGLAARWWKGWFRR